MNIRKHLERVAENYCSNIGLRFLVAQIPFVGNSIELVLSTTGQKKSENRILGFVDALTTEFDKLEETTIKKDYFETDEGYDLLNKSFNAVIRTGSKEKQKYFAKILANASTQLEINYLHEDFFTIIDELSEKELVYLKEIYHIRKSHLGGNYFHPASMDSHLDNIKHHLYYIKRLEKVGLLTPIHEKGIFKLSGIQGYMFVNIVDELIEFVLENENL